MATLDNTSPRANEMKGVLAWIERAGNRLPDPVFIFLWCIATVIVVSVLCALAGVSAPHPTQVDAAGNPVVIGAESLLSAANIQRLFHHRHDLRFPAGDLVCHRQDDRTSSVCRR